jgi:hypothetical protein
MAYITLEEMQYVPEDASRQILAPPSPPRGWIASWASLAAPESFSLLLQVCHLPDATLLYIFSMWPRLFLLFECYTSILGRSPPLLMCARLKSKVGC